MSEMAERAERTRKLELPKGRMKKVQKKPKPIGDNGQESGSKTTVSRRGLLFCPKCGSANVFWASGLPHLWSVWDCRNCGYRGAFIIRDGKLAEKIRENYTKKTARQ